MEYYSVLKRNGLSRHEKTLRNLKCILLSERIQYEKATHCAIPIFDILEKENYGDSKKGSGCQRSVGLAEWD